MQVTIKFKSDNSTIPYCAYVEEPDYCCAWSANSFEEAERLLVAKLTAKQHQVPPIPKIVELPLLRRA